jgi:hypothetical protein
MANACPIGPLRDYLEHIPKFRNGSGKILANASTPDFSATSDIILGYALRCEESNADA